MHNHIQKLKHLCTPPNLCTPLIYTEVIFYNILVVSVKSSVKSLVLLFATKKDIASRRL